MLKQILFLISIIFFIQINCIYAKNNKSELRINSDNLEINSIKNDLTYTGNVIAKFENYVIKTEKIIFKISNSKDKKLDMIIFPAKLKLFTTDNCVEFSLPYATYDSKSGFINSNGKIKIRYLKTIINSKEINMEIGRLKTLNIKKKI